MKPILQSQATECSLARLTMLATFHGQHLDLSEFRGRFSVSLKGANFRQLTSQATALGFSSRPLRLDLQELGDLKLPCILHWDLNHFVVLKKVNRKSMTLLDPAVGERRLSLDENAYAAGVKVTGEELAEVSIERDEFHGEWSYRIKPHRARRIRRLFKLLLLDA